MEKPFTVDEISKAVKKLKNGKNVGVDEIKAEMLKYGPKIIHQKIAEIFNDMARTGDTPEEITKGILIPLPKPGKPQGLPSNLRPIILLTMLRKILAICMLERTSEKIRRKIPLSQAAYDSGRSTTEHVFTFKLLAEKAITSADYEVTLLMLDMSKAFDTVRRKDRINILKEVLDDDEIHIMKILLQNVNLIVRVGRETGEDITTNIGVPQGDCLSPLLFIVYLANAMEEERSIMEQEHRYARPTTNIDTLLPPHLQDHSYVIPTDPYLIIDQQYADDTGWASTSKHKTEVIKKSIPQTLKDKNLSVNETKTEEYTIKRNEDEAWKSCKYLDSMLDTRKDITRRKGFAMAAYNKMKHILENQHISTDIKMRIFNAYVSSIFLYNSELWTVTQALNHEIDVFQRILLRKIMKIKWQDHISNENLYTMTNQHPWSKTIKKRRFSWFGHLARLPVETPVIKALTEFRRPVRKPKGKQKTTWYQMIKKNCMP